VAIKLILFRKKDKRLHWRRCRSLFYSPWAQIIVFHWLGFKLTDNQSFHWLDVGKTCSEIECYQSSIGKFCVFTYRNIM